MSSAPELKVVTKYPVQVFELDESRKDWLRAYKWPDDEIAHWFRVDRVFATRQKGGFRETNVDMRMANKQIAQIEKEMRENDVWFGNGEAQIKKVDHFMRLPVDPSADDSDSYLLVRTCE